MLALRFALHALGDFTGPQMAACMLVQMATTLVCHLMAG